MKEKRSYWQNEGQPFEERMTLLKWMNKKERGQLNKKKTNWNKEQTKHEKEKGKEK